MKRVRQKCDPKMVKEFNYSRLSGDFTKLSKPAQRALINNGIYSAADLARHSAEDVSEFHGTGPSAMPILRKALRKHRLKFKRS
jgi:hypothetical protein